jgi:hypothetical protein
MDHLHNAWPPLPSMIEDEPCGIGFQDWSKAPPEFGGWQDWAAAGDFEPSTAQFESLFPSYMKKPLERAFGPSRTDINEFIERLLPKKATGKKKKARKAAHKAKKHAKSAPKAKPKKKAAAKVVAGRKAVKKAGKKRH